MTPEDHREVFREGWNAALEEVRKVVQGARESGEADLRGILAAIRGLKESEPQRERESP